MSDKKVTKVNKTRAIKEKKPPKKKDEKVVNHDKKIREAFKIAAIHLKKFEKYNKNIVRHISTIYPIFEPFGKEPTFFEVALQDEKCKKNGYILVSLRRDLPPILKFSFTGKSDFNLLKEKVGSTEFTPVLLTPFCIVAEDKYGNYITHYGELATLPSDVKKLGKEFDYNSFKKSHVEQLKKKIRKMEKSALYKWNKIIKKKIKTTADTSEVEYIQPSDVPSYDFQVVTARHIEYLGRYTQIAPNQGANSAHNFWSGCTACAWMSLIGYHNNVYTLDSLRGTHYTRGDINSYLSRVMVALSEHLGTHKASNSDGGGCSPSNIKKGYSFIKNVMGYSIVNKKFAEDDGIPALQVVYDAVCFWGVPSVISIPGHSLIAYEVLADLNDDRGEHYMRVYKGGGGAATNDPYIPYELIDDGAWTFERMNTNHEVRLNYRSLSTPVTIELGNPQFGNVELVVAIRLPNENIGLLYSQNGRDFDLRYEIEATGRTPPCLAVQDSGFSPYIAWKQADKTLKLAQVNAKYNCVTELPAPLGLSEFHNMGPVIQVHNGKLFYIWDNNITYTNVQNFERSARPWPSELGYHDYNDSYLGSLGLIIPVRTPRLISYGGHLILSYTMDRSYLGWLDELVLFKLTSDGDIEYFKDSTGNTVFQSERNLIKFMGVFYGSRGEISEIRRIGVIFDSEAKYYPYGIIARELNLGVFSTYEIGPSVFTVYLNTDDYVVIRYHSIDTTPSGLDYTGWPHF